ncbi:glutamate racemase [Brassicibacter mesophilus]|uniref:glutamate racemase n=1 Tax=Brassicibacter mesophilus TaxID=745119 RepID=UPI003D246596
MRIGVFDSGIGGLTVLNEAMKMMPNEEYIYFADTYNVPYGTKTKDEVKKSIFEITDFLCSKGIDALLIACNTATSIGVDEVRQKYSFPIIGMEPAVKYALNYNKNKKVLVLATSLTLKQDRYTKLVNNIDSKRIVESLALPGLVEFAENYIFDRNVILDYLNNEFYHYNLEEFGVIVLGCTHFIYYKDYIEELIPEHVCVVDGNYGTVNHMISILKDKLSSNHGGQIEFYQSDKDGIRVAQFKKYMQLLK